MFSSSSAFDPRASRNKFISQLASEICKSGKTMKQCFDQLDTSGDGKLGIDEFRTMAKQVNSSLSEFDVLVLFSEIASIGFSEFDTAVTKARMQTALEKSPHIGMWVKIAGEVEASGKTVQQCFEKIDVNQDGSVSQQELWNMMKKINTTMTEDEFKCAFALVDTSSDGSISLLQFQAAVETARAQPPQHSLPMKIKRHVYNARGGPPPYRGSYLTATDAIELDANATVQSLKSDIIPPSGFAGGMGSGELATFPADAAEAPRRWEFPSPGGQMLDAALLGKTVGEVFANKAVVILMPMYGFD